MIISTSSYVTQHYHNWLYHHLHLLPTRLLGYAVRNPDGLFPTGFIASTYYQLAASEPPELSQSRRIRPLPYRPNIMTQIWKDTRALQLAQPAKHGRRDGAV